MPKKDTKQELLIAASNALVNAYREGARNDGSVEWNDVDIAANFAAKATGRSLDPDKD